MGGLFGSRSPPPAPVTKPIPSRSDADVQAAALATRLRRSSAIGRTETIVSKGADEENLTTKKLLGFA